MACKISAWLKEMKLEWAKYAQHCKRYNQEVAKMKAMIHDRRMAEGGSGNIDVPFVPQQRQAPKCATPIHCLMHDRIESCSKYSKGKSNNYGMMEGSQINTHS